MPTDSILNSFKNSFRENLGRIGEQFRQYSQMPLEDRLGELDKLRNIKRGFKRKLDVIDTRTLLLENMPDVAEYKVKTDKLAVSLLEHLKEKGDTPYRELQISDEYFPVFFHYLHLFRTAQLIELSPDLSFPEGMDSIIKLTERGRSLQYAEQRE